MELAKSQKKLTQIKGAYTYIGTGYTVSDEFVKNIIENIAFAYCVEDDFDGELQWSGTGSEEFSFGLNGLDEYYTLDVFVNFNVSGNMELSRGDGYLTPTEYFMHCTNAEVEKIEIYIGGDDVYLTNEQESTLKKAMDKKLCKRLVD